MWRLLGAARWLGALAALAGAGWLAAAHRAGVAAPILLIAAGLLVAAAATVTARQLLASRVRVVRGEADRRLRAAVLELTRSSLVEPVRGVLTRYAHVRDALRAIRG